MKGSKINHQGQRQEYVKELFAKIAPDYDRLNSIISLYLHHQWRRLAIKKAVLKEDDNILDLGTGTADFAIEAAKVAKKGRVVGIDFCREMLEIGREKVMRLRLERRVELKEGQVLPIPFEKETFDCVTMGFLLRHIEIPRIFEEVFRVLKPGGIVVTLDAGRPQNAIINRAHHLYFYNIIPWLGRLFHGDSAPYKYLPQSTKQYLPIEQELKEIMERTGFRAVEYFKLLFGAAVIHLGFKE